MPVAARRASASRPLGLGPGEEEVVSRVRRIRVAAVRGACNAQLEVGDTFHLEGLSITPQGNDRACCFAFASIVANVGRLKLEPGPIHVSCPDPATGTGGNVLFEVAEVPGDEDDPR